MIAVIFEVEPAPGRQREYLDLAAALREELGTVEGFLSVERFQSVTRPERMLSLSFFRDEDAARRWRNTAAHRATQARGRAGVFADYRLRVASVLRDYGMTERAEAPSDSLTAHGLCGTAAFDAGEGGADAGDGAPTNGPATLSRGVCRPARAPRSWPPT